MLHEHLLYINKTEEHLADLITYKKHNSDPTKPIRNDFLHSPTTRLQNQKLSNPQ